MPKPLPWIAVSVAVAFLAAPLAQAQDARRAASEPYDDLPLIPWAHPPQPAELPPAPPDGGVFIGTGALALTFGSLTTAALGACKSSKGWSEGCVGGVAGAGVGLLALGGSLLAVGVVKRNRFRAWRRQHLPPPRPARVVLAPTLGGGLLVFDGAF